MDEQDKLYNATKFYMDELEGRTFYLQAGKRGVLANFYLTFQHEQFKHLIGLGKLKDIIPPTLTSRILIERILNKELTYEDISKSKFFNQMKKRVEYFQDIKKTLFSKELMIRALHGEFNLIKADFMLTQTAIEQYGYAHLFFQKDKDEIHIPVTYIIHPNNSYLRNNPNRWTILSVEELERSQIEVKEGKPKNALEELKAKKTQKKADERRASVEEYKRTTGQAHAPNSTGKDENGR